MIELTVLTPDQWSQWRDLRLRALTEDAHAFGARIEEWKDADETRWRKRLSLPGSANFIARLDGRPVGMASGLPTSDPRVAELIVMWVAPESRGRGAADVLITGVTQWAREQDAWELHLDVVALNAPAIALYTRHGFVIGEHPTEADSRVMVKVLRTER